MSPRLSLVRCRHNESAHSTHKRSVTDFPAWIDRGPCSFHGSPGLTAFSFWRQTTERALVPLDARQGKQGIPILAVECARERIGTHPCDSRRPVDELQVAVSSNSLFCLRLLLLPECWGTYAHRNASLLTVQHEFPYVDQHEFPYVDFTRVEPGAPSLP